MLSPHLAAKSAQSFPYALGFLPLYPANAKRRISKSLPCLGAELQHLVQTHFFLVTESGILSAGSVLPTHNVSAEKGNRIFLLLLFIPGVHICNTDSPVHSCSTLLIKAIFCNILFTLPTFIITEISPGESSQCSRMVTVNDDGSG